MMEEQVTYPKKSRDINNMLMDTKRWDGFEFRDDDIVINTWAKSGTTWTQQIVTQLIFNGEEKLRAMDLAPWLELKLIPFDEVIDVLNGQTHRRFIKSHAPADTLDINPQAKYLFLARDGRDVIWSWYSHLLNMKIEFFDELNAIPGREGPPLTKPDGTVHEFFHEWMDESGLYDWPYWDHVQSWWNLRELPNVKIIHFNDLKADLAGEMRNIAGFLGIDFDEDRFPDIVHHCTFDYMKANADDLSDVFDKMFEGGLKNFIHKGTNRRWADTLTPEDIELYERVVSENMTPDCAHWHATGQMPD